MNRKEGQVTGEKGIYFTVFILLFSLSLAFGTAGPQNSAYAADPNVFTENVGIGTATPVAALDVIAGAQYAAYIHNNNASGITMLLRNYGATSWGLYDDTSPKHYFAGNVGIGTTDPGGKLEIKYNAGSLLKLTNTSGEDYTLVDLDSAGGLIFDTYGAHATVSPGQYIWKQAGSEKMRIISGNVGIGTAVPKGLLQVGSTGADSNGELVLAKRSGAPNRKFKFGLDANYNLSVGDYGNNTDDTYLPWMTIKYANGFVGIGSTVPQYELDVVGDIRASRNIYGSVAGASFTTGSVIFAGASGLLSQKNAKFFWDDTNERLGIGTAVPEAKLDVNGGIYTTAGTKSAPAYSFSTDPDTGMYSRTDNRVTFANGGVAQGEMSAAYGFGINSGTTFYWVASTVDAGSIDTGLSRLAANKIGVGNGFTGDYSGTLIAGNVGIGTAVPGEKLDVRGNINMGTGTDAAGNRSTLKINNGGYAEPTVNSNSNGDKLWLYDSGASYKVAIGMDSSAAMWFQSNTAFEWWNGVTPTQNMTLVGGNLGIGTAVPTSLLNIKGPNSDGTGNYYSQLRIQATGTYPDNIAGLSFENTGQQENIRFIQSGAPKFQIRYNEGNTTTNKLHFYSFITGHDMVTFDANNDRVGIGTAAPTAFRLTVRGATTGGSDPADSIMSVVNGDEGTWGTGIFAIKNAGNRGTKDHASGSALFTASFSDVEAFRIDKGGNVGIGTASPGSRLDAYSTANPAGVPDPVLRLQAYTDNSEEGPSIDFISNWTAVYPNWRVARIAGIYDSSASNGGALAFYTQSGPGADAGATEKVRIRPNGYVGIGTASPGNKLEVYGGGITNKMVVTANNYDRVLEQFAYGTPLTSPTQVPANSLLLGQIAYAWDGTLNRAQGYTGFWTNQAITAPSQSRWFVSDANGTQILIVNTATSRVGIGSTSPVYALDVVGDIRLTGSVIAPAGGSTQGYWALSGSNLSPTSTSYNVGIGIASPGLEFHVVGSDEMFRF